jgi:collagen type III alpha
MDRDSYEAHTTTTLCIEESGMATTIEPRTKEPASRQYVDFDEYIEYQLQKTRTKVKWTDVLTAAAGVAALVLGYLLVFVLLDHWIVPGGFGTTMRLVMLGGVAVIGTAWLAWMIAIPWFKSVNALFAARLIEKSDPEMHSTLLNLIDLRRAGKPVPESIRRTLEKRAALRLSHLDVDQAVDRRPLMRVSYALLALVALACMYTLFSPKKISSSVWRALAPTADVAVATRTEIHDVRPGDVEVLARTQLEVTADLRGETPERVTLYYTTADRKYVDEPVEMRQVDENLRRYRAIIAGEGGGGVLQNKTYRIEAGDAVTRDFQVAVRQPPSARVDEVSYVYPDYMEFPPRTQSGGHIDAWEGTTVTVTAKANMPVRSAVLVLSDDDDLTRRTAEIPMEVTDGARLRAEWKLTLRDETAQPRYPRFYRIQCYNESRETDPQPTLYTINVRPDERPEVELLDPTGDLERPANAMVPLLIRARDPDFKLRFINLRVEKNGEEIGNEEIFDGHRQRFSTRYEFRLEKLNLEPGETISYWIEARDNKQPIGNRRNTPKLDITITEPVAPEDAEKQLEDDKQRQDEMLEESRQRRNEQGLDDDPMDDMEDMEDAGDEGRDGEAGRDEGEGDAEAESKPGDDGTERQEQEGTGDEGDETGAEGEAEGDGEGSQRQERRRLDPEDDEEALRELIERFGEDEASEGDEGAGGDADRSEGDKQDENGDQPEGRQPGESEPDGTEAGEQDPDHENDGKGGRLICMAHDDRNSVSNTLQRTALLTLDRLKALGRGRSTQAAGGITAMNQ